MGTDNLHHKRKARKAQDMKRRSAKRAPYEKVLIVCEGEKTEPNYFEGLKSHYKLNSTNVEVTGETGSSPISLWRYAEKRFKAEKNAGDPFDRVYCVFDQDSHASYNEACAKIESATPRNTFFSTRSIPSFEYWLLLHFNYTTKPFEPLSGNSVGNQVLTELRKHMPNYQKGLKDTFEYLADRLETAIQNANRALEEAKGNHTDNPSTYVQELVEYLRNIKKTP